MTRIIKSSESDTIALPPDVLKDLNLWEGDEVQVSITGETLRLARLDDVLALRGALADDDEFDRAMEFLDEAWKSWRARPSA